jgi:Flp pilus assembly protein TadG
MRFPAPPARWRGGTRDRGSMTAETVLLAPVFLLFLMFLVGAGRLVEAQGEVNGAARDAARAASVQRTLPDAESAATDAATAALSGQCADPSVSLAGSRWEEGGQVQAEVGCEVDLEFLGFGAAKRITGTSVVPLEQFRRVE